MKIISIVARTLRSLAGRRPAHNRECAALQAALAAAAEGRLTGHGYGAPRAADLADVLRDALADLHRWGGCPIEACDDTMGRWVQERQFRADHARCCDGEFFASVACAEDAAEWEDADWDHRAPDLTGWRSRVPAPWGAVPPAMHAALGKPALAA